MSSPEGAVTPTIWCEHILSEVLFVYNYEKQGQFVENYGFHGQLQPFLDLIHTTNAMKNTEKRLGG